MQLQEVSRVHSTPRASTELSRKSLSRGKERIQPIKKLHPQYVAGFVDGEGSFWVSIYKDDCMKNKVLVRPEFSIELRDDDKEILHRIKETIGCGKIYECKYERYGWYPHVKLKVSRFDEISGVNEIKKLQEKMRVLGKKHRLETARVRENRLPSGVGQ